MAAEMSPVKAPLALGWQSCAPSETALPASRTAALMMSVAGGQTRISALPPFPSATIRRLAAISSRALLRPFIFQLPATRGRGSRDILASRTSNRGFHADYHPAAAYAKGRPLAR